MKIKDPLTPYLENTLNFETNHLRSTTDARVLSNFYDATIR